MSFSPEEILAEAKRQLQLQEKKEALEKQLLEQKVHEELLTKEKALQKERIRLLAEEEQVRLTAQRLMIETEAKAIADAKERAVQKEIERLRNRTPLEIIEDKVKELEIRLNTPPKPSIEPETVTHLEEKLRTLEYELQEQKEHNRYIHKTVQESLVDLRVSLEEAHSKSTGLDDVKQHVQQLESFLLNYLNIKQATNKGINSLNTVLHFIESYKVLRKMKPTQRKFRMENTFYNGGSISHWGGGAFPVYLNVATKTVDIWKGVNDSQVNGNKNLIASVPFEKFGLEYDYNKKYILYITYTDKTFEISPTKDGEAPYVLYYNTISGYENYNAILGASFISGVYGIEEIFE